MKQLIFTSFILLITTTCCCQAGSLDKSFGKDGIVSANFSTLFGPSAVQGDGKILVGGNTSQGNIIARFLPDGTIDNSFGENGFALLNDIKGDAAAIKLQPDAKIVITGPLAGKTLTEGTYAARLKPDGSFDSTFGVNGVTRLDFGDYGGATSLALQSDGKILLAGAATTNPETFDGEYMTVIRLLPDGTLDKTFGGDGRLENGNSNNSNDVAVQPDGKILTCGYNIFNETGTDYVISRYNTDGTLDETFGNRQGNSIIDGFGGNDTPESLFLQPDGKIVVGGYSEKGIMEHMVALRFTSDGMPDNSFGNKGKVPVSFDEKASRAFDALLQPDGKIVLTGSAYKNNPPYNTDFASCRLTSNGLIDSSFAVNGRQVTELTTYEEAKSALLQPDGKIVLVGSSYNDNTEEFNTLLIRYLGDKQERPLIAKIKRFLHNHGIGWKGENSSVAYYSVEKSTGTTGFHEVARVNKNSTQDYSYIISSTSSVSSTEYYRIREVNTSGRSTYSNIVVLHSPSGDGGISIYPNPVKGMLTINNLDANSTSKIIIADLSGTVWLSAISRQQSTAKYDVSKLKSGTYVLTVTNGTTNSDLKFVKE